MTGKRYQGQPSPASIAFVRKLLALFEQEAQVLDEPLTPREQEVLRLLVDGASNQEIATHLVIPLTTVKKHVSNVLGKLGVESRIQAIARAREWSHPALRVVLGWRAL